MPSTIDSRTALGPVRIADPGPAVRRSALERMPKWLICVPLALQWLWLAARYRGLTLPSAANPCITAGGLVGEGKLEYFRAMGPLARAATARQRSTSRPVHLPWLSGGIARGPPAGMPRPQPCRRSWTGPGWASR